MSMISSKYLQMTYPSPAKDFFPSPQTPVRYEELGVMPHTKELTINKFPETKADIHHPPRSVETNRRLKSLLKAVGFIIPAILLARIKPSERVIANALKESIPSDWKVWAKIGLGIASINQVNKALNWTPPPWLGAFLNVCMMAGLMTGFTRDTAKTITTLGPWVSALVQGTHYANQKIEKPLDEKFNIPPVVTKLILSVLSMATGFIALPRLMALTEAEVPSVGAAKTRALTSGGCACCGGSPVCFTELANNANLAMTQIQKHFTSQKKELS